MQVIEKLSNVLVPECKETGDGAFKEDKFSEDAMQGNPEGDIFAPESQEPLSLEHMGNGEIIDDVSTLKYRYTLQTQKQGALAGNVWLAQESGN